MKWPKEGDFWNGGYCVIHSSSNNGNSGVGIILRKSRGIRELKGYYQISDRKLMVRLETKLKDIIAAQVFVPTSDCEDDEIEDMYDSIEEVTKTIK
jgi:exonuclease III